jgi:hypothetical protein
MAAKNVNKAEVNEGGRPPRYTRPMSCKQRSKNTSVMDAISAR